MIRGRALIADDHPVVRDALRLVVSSKWPLLEIDQASSIEDIERVLRKSTDYRLVLLDLMLPDAHGFSGLIFVKKLLEATPVVMISSRYDAQTVASAHILGAAAFISKSAPLEQMTQTMERALTGESNFSKAAQPNAASNSLAEASRRIASLSATQLRVLLALADGRLNKQIANDMSVTEATVKAHMTMIFRKLAVQNRTQAILAARPLLESGA